MTDLATQKNLATLKKAYMDAKEAYRAHKPIDEDSTVEDDLEERRLLNACTAAEIAYEQALDTLLTVKKG